MAKGTVGVRGLKAQFSKYLRQVKIGRSFIVTEHGKAVCMLVPTGRPLEERLHATVDSGRADWNGRHPKATKPPAKARKGSSVSDLLLENRR